MNFRLLSGDQVVRLHDMILDPGELPELARDKSLDGTLARIDNRLAYGLIGDVCDLAAAYAAAIARGHWCNGGNKRTAFRTMQMCLFTNGMTLPDAPDAELGDLIIRLAHRKIEDGDLADWLRDRARAQD